MMKSEISIGVVDHSICVPVTNDISLFKVHGLLNLPDITFHLSNLFCGHVREYFFKLYVKHKAKTYAGFIYCQKLWNDK